MNLNQTNLSSKRASGKRSRKRKFTGNKFTRSAEQKVPNNESASGKKLDISFNKTEIESSGIFNGYSIIDTSLLFHYIEKFLSCKTCGGTITLKEKVVYGLSSKISIECKNCTELCAFRNSEMIGTKRNCAEINRRFVYAMRTIGKGHASMKLFCGTMDLPQPISKKSYNSVIRKLSACTNLVAKHSMKSAAEEEIKLTGSKNIVVSGDGTWKTRGHTSRVGVCTVIGDNCGKVIDTEVLSSYCKSCEFWKSKEGTAEYSKWKISHEKECLLNHTGSAGKMEIVGMVRIFQRSEMENDTKYIGYIGDGDAKTFNAIVDVSPYGSDTPITKIECVGHIQKRMGARLRKLKQSRVKCSDGKSIGGKGRLTDKLIDKLTVYYGNAIRQHKNSLHDMRKAVWAIYFHTRSTDSESLHTFCPLGADSWCRYQKSVVNGTVDNFKHKNIIPGCVMDIIKPVFKDLSHPKLLQRCLGGKTQNNNESLNSLIWKLCPKTLGTGRKIAEIATNEATMLFNDGNISRIKLMKELGLNVGSYATNCYIKLDEQRVKTAELRFLQNTKEMRQIRRRNQKAIAENLLTQEGQTYEAGGF